jgi:hypothetical protein
MEHKGSEILIHHRGARGRDRLGVVEQRLRKLTLLMVEIGGRDQPTIRKVR